MAQAEGITRPREVTKVRAGPFCWIALHPGLGLGSHGARCLSPARRGGGGDKEGEVSGRMALSQNPQQPSASTSRLEQCPKGTGSGAGQGLGSE